MNNAQNYLLDLLHITHKLLKLTLIFMVALSKLLLQIKFCNKIPLLVLHSYRPSPETHSYCPYYLIIPIPRNLDCQDIHLNSHRKSSAPHFLFFLKPLLRSTLRQVVLPSNTCTNEQKL